MLAIFGRRVIFDFTLKKSASESYSIYIPIYLLFICYLIISAIMFQTLEARLMDEATKQG